jgi:hypothetical protein
VNQDGKDAELPQIEWLAFCEDEWERDGSLPRIVYTPHPDVTSETETEILASVYRYVLQCHERREAAGKVGGDENVPGAGRAGELLSKAGDDCS